jgi:hypothetical protein
MIDTVKSPIEGRFKVEVLKDFEVIDSFEDHNTICINARRGMASIFSNIIEAFQKPHACRLALGTCGVTKNRFTPRVENKTYTRDLQHLFTEQYADDYITNYSSQTANVLTPYKIYRYNDEYYRYLNPDNADSYTINHALLSNTKVFEKDYKPYLYTVPFDIFDKTFYSADLGYKMKVDRSKAQCEAFVNVVNTTDATDNDGNVISNFKSTVQFVWVIPKNYANNQISSSEYDTQMTFFNEACLYVNDDQLFCYRAFPTKVKDSSTALRITWKIIF